MTYPAAYRQKMDGKTIHAVLEDVADNLFNKDPYYQQGGDMVRVGGMAYRIKPQEKIGNRISDMTLVRIRRSRSNPRGTTSLPAGRR